MLTRVALPYSRFSLPVATTPTVIGRPLIVRRLCARHHDDVEITKDFELRLVNKDDVEIAFSRSSGPGGQNVNKVNTKVDMRLSVRDADWIPSQVKTAIIHNNGTKINKEGELVITSTKHRTQIQNIDDALAKMNAIIERAVESVKPREVDPVKKKKIAKQKKKANEHRLKQKKLVSMRKADRRRTDW